MTKALGMTVYIRPNTEATTLYSTICVTSIDGSGITATAETLEPCLSDTATLEFPADPKYNQQTVEYKKVVGDSGITIDLEASALAKTEINYAVKYPTTPAVYELRTAYLISHTDLATDRNQDLKCQMVLAPQDGKAISTNEPSTS